MNAVKNQKVATGVRVAGWYAWLAGTATDRQTDGVQRRQSEATVGVRLLIET